MSTLQELLEQQKVLEERDARIKAEKEALLLQIKNIQQAGRKDLIQGLKKQIAEHQLTVEELFGISLPTKPGRGKAAKSTPSDKPVRKVEPKYRDPLSGKEWTGRGVSPKWISDSGKDKSEFLIVR